MKIDNALQKFAEKYDRAAMESIEDLSTDFTYTIKPHYIKAFNIKESFDMFQSYMRGYAKYNIENKNNDDVSPYSAICESVNNFIDTKLFRECDILYSDMSSFVSSYINGIKELTETVNTIKRDMMDADIELERVGEVNTFCDRFMDLLHESFDPAMDRILWATGYNTRKAFDAARPKKKETHVFL